MVPLKIILWLVAGFFGLILAIYFLFMCWAVVTLVIYSVRFSLQRRKLIRYLESTPGLRDLYKYAKSRGIEVIPKPKGMTGIGRWASMLPTKIIIAHMPDVVDPRQRYAGLVCFSHEIAHIESFERRAYRSCFTEKAATLKPLGIRVHCPWEEWLAWQGGLTLLKSLGIKIDEKTEARYWKDALGLIREYKCLFMEQGQCPKQGAIERMEEAVKARISKIKPA